MPNAVNVRSSGNPDIDGLLHGTAWSTPSLTYSFPTDGSFYGANYEGGSGQNTQGFAQLNTAQQAAVVAVLADYSAVSNLQFTQITETASQHAVLREAQSSLPGTADTYYPGTNYTSPASSDSWYGNTHNWLQNPVIGDYGYYVFLHEIGLALGLEDDTTGTNLPEAHDAMEYSVESYRSYVGASVANGLHNEAGSYAQSLMIDDIAAIQYLYGANWSAVGTTVTYSWDPSTGQEFINGVGQGTPAEDKIFTTIWDQGATTTYNLSNYTTNLVLDLRPGRWSTFSAAQLAEVGDDSSGIVFADGNVANALEYGNDPRSLVTGAIGGSGHNVIIGNNAGDDLYGGTGGGNTITGGGGNDTIDGGPGGNNTAVYSGARSSYRITELANGWLQIADLRAGAPDGTDRVTEIQNFQFADGTYTIDQLGLPGPTISVSDIAASPGQSIAASSLVSVTQTVAPIVIYEFEDATANGGHFVVNGVAQAANQAIDVSAANLSQAGFQAGNGTTDDLWVRASDGTVWSQWQEFHVSAFDLPPVVTAASVTAARGQAFAASSLFSASDPVQGESIIDYQFWDSTADPQSGYFTVGGIVQGANQTIDVPTAQLAQTQFQSASGANLLWVRASDGQVWSNWQSFTVTAPIDHAPVVTTSNVGVPLNFDVPVASLFTATDPDPGVTIVKYQFWDSATNPGSGHFVVDGLAQGANQAIDVAASDLGQAFYMSPSAPNSDLLWVRASDGILWSSWESFTLTAPAVLLPKVNASDLVLPKNTEIAASNLFTAAVPYLQTAITEYQFWQTPTAGSGSHFVVDGAVEAANAVIDVTAANLPNAYFQAGSDTVDQLWVRASTDGQVWSGWTPFTVAAPNHPPVVTVSSVTATHDQVLAAATLFSATDPDPGDSVVQYQLWETASDLSGGFFEVNGVAQGLNQTITVTPDQLAQTAFQTGSGSVLLWVRATDGQDWSSWQRLTVTAPLDHAPTVSASDINVLKNTVLAASSLFTATPSDPSFGFVDYQFWDSTSDPLVGKFMVNGVVQGTNQIIDVAAANLAQATFQAGGGSSDLWVRASDGVMWSGWQEFHVTAQDHAPVVSASNVTAGHGQAIAASSLFSAVDPDAGDTVVQYQLWDSGSGPACGNFEINGIAQAANQTINVSPAQLGQTTFQSGSGSDLLWVRASDGQLWSDWQSFTVTAPIDHAPVVAGANASLTLGQSVQASALFTVSDADSDPITAYQFWETTSNPQGGSFTVNGAAQSLNQAINVSAAQLSQTSFTAATSPGSDQLWVRASDGIMWSDWHPMTVTSHA